MSEYVFRFSVIDSHPEKLVCIGRVPLLKEHGMSLVYRDFETYKRRVRRRGRELGLQWATVNMTQIDEDTDQTLDLGNETLRFRKPKR